MSAKGVLTCGITVLSLLGGRVFVRNVDAFLHDRLFRCRNRIFPHQRIDDRITLVGIDDRTNRDIGAYGKGKWLTRMPFVQQLQTMRQYPPAVVAYDILFMDPLAEGERQADDFRADSGANREVDTVLEQFRNSEDVSDADALEKLSTTATLIGDSALAYRLSLLSDDVPVILAYHLPLKRETQRRRWEQKDILGPDPEDLDEEYGLSVPYLRDVSIPLDNVHNLPEDFQFIEHRAKLPSEDIMAFGELGFINVPRDPDGVVRRVPMVLGIGYTFRQPQTGSAVTRRFLVPSFSLLTCLRAWNVKLPSEGSGAASVEVDFGRRILVHRPDGTQVAIPIDKYGRFSLDCVVRTLDYRTISFSRVTDDPRMDAYLTDKVVFVGLTATGAGDVGPLSITEHAPMVLTHMTAVNNVLKQQFIVPADTRTQLLIMAGVGAAFCLIGAFLRPSRISLLSGVCVVSYIGVAYAGIHRHAFLLPLIAPVTLMVSSYMTDLLVYYFAEEREKKKIRNMFQTMVSGDVLQYMEDNPESFSLAGEEREATMFFSDVAGFTTISESLTPELLVELLNAYLTPMTEIIMRHHGYVDKYEGDAIMAEWGVPFPSDDHAKLACFAALEQQTALAAMRADLHRRFGHELYVRMGLNTGVVSAGNMGSESRFSYTVMGDAVNQAARFEPANKDYGTDIMIGATTFDRVKDHVEARLLDKIVVKGKTEPIEIYELMAEKGELSSARQDVAGLYQEALRLHWEREFDRALGKLEEALAVDPEDSPSKALLARITHYRSEPPEDKWQGEYIRTSKD